MQALVLTAGDGTRLRPITKKIPKGLIKIWDVPILERVLNSLKNGGVDEVILVIGHLGEKIRKHFGDNWKGLKIRYAVSTWYGDGILKSIQAGEKLIKGRFLFLCGDTIVSSSVIRGLIKSNGDVVECVSRLKGNNPTTALVEKDGKIKRIGEGLEKYNKSVPGIAILTPPFWKGVKYCIKKGKKTRSHVIQWMIDNGYKVNTYEIDEWYDIDTHKDLKIVERQIFEHAWKDRILKEEGIGLFKKYITLPVTLRLTKLFSKTSLTPNQITLIGLFFFILAGLLFLMENFIIGGVILYIGALIDGVDGKIARLKLKQSNFGACFDSITDRFGDAWIILTLSLVLYMKMMYLGIVVLGFATLFTMMCKFYSKELFLSYFSKKEPYIPWIIRMGYRDRICFAMMILCIINPLFGLVYWFFFFFISMLFWMSQIKRFKPKD